MSRPLTHAMSMTFFLFFLNSKHVFPLSPCPLSPYPRPSPLSGPGEDMVLSLQKLRAGVDEKIKAGSVQLFKGAAPMTGEHALSERRCLTLYRCRATHMGCERTLRNA